ncbi:hypothetical protein IPH92_00895 [Candidatus Kaiserbacteria bacterium]|nr:MAG: hypothetical protein IPH92_00895 [Candidatus Kaiserbacteria bacterium]
MSKDKSYLIWHRIGIVSGIVLLLLICFVFTIGVPIVFDIPHKVELYRSPSDSEPLVTMSIPRYYKVHSNDIHNVSSIKSEYCSEFEDVNSTFIELQYFLYGEHDNSVYDTQEFLLQLNNSSANLQKPDAKQITYTDLGSVVVGNTTLNKFILKYPVVSNPSTYYVKPYDTGYLVIHTQGVFCSGRQQVTDSDIQSMLDTIVFNNSL